MIIDAPRGDDLPHLRKLWTESFGDTEAFWRDFIAAVRPLAHCRCLWEEKTLAAALYWFDCNWEDKPIAYLYGVATAKAFRGRGACRALMEDTHRYLKKLGYHGIVLVPAEPWLFEMYRKMGYTLCANVREFTCAAGDPIPLQQLTPEQYAARRRQFLPAGGVVQEGATLELIATQGKFYAAERCLAVCSVQNEKLVVSELLGEAEAAPGLVAALGFREGAIRTPGKDKAFAMYHSLTDDPAAPRYFGLAMD